ncbi:MAG: CPBP family intramembrane glutamic endopeptidase [Chloroflexota bacterium]
MDTRKRKAFWLYVVLAYVITWLPWIPVEVIAAQRDYVMPNPLTIPELIANGFQDNTHLILALLTIVSILLPGTVIGAIIAQAYESGKAGLRGWWQRVTHWRVGWRWYGIMLGLLGLIFLPIFILGMIKGPLPTSGQVTSILVWVVPMFLYTFLASGMEEPGWRGYLLPNLQTRMSAKKASVIIGIVWGIWHWPVFIPVYFATWSSPGGVPQAVITVLVQLILYTAGSIMSGALTYTWLYNRTGSAFLCILFHVLHNNLSTFTLMLFPDLGGTIPMLGTIAQWIIAIVLMRFFWTEARESKLGQFAVHGQPSEI